MKATDAAFADHRSAEVAVPAHYDTGLGVAFTDKYLPKAHSHQAAIHLTTAFRKYAVSRVIGAGSMQEEERAGANTHPGSGRIWGLVWRQKVVHTGLLL